MLVKVKQKPLSYYEKIIPPFSVVEMYAKVQLRLVVLVAMWGANYTSLKYESYIEGQKRLEFVESFLDAS